MYHFLKKNCSHIISYFWAILDPSFPQCFQSKNLNINCFDWRRPIMEDDLKILKVEYLSYPLLDLPHILNLRLMNQPKSKSHVNEDNLYIKWRQPPMEDDLKIAKGEYLHNNCMDHELWVPRGNLEGNSKEISSVALLSPACSLSVSVLSNSLSTSLNSWPQYTKQ